MSKELCKSACAARGSGSGVPGARSAAGWLARVRACVSPRGCCRAAQALPECPRQGLILDAASVSKHVQCCLHAVGKLLDGYLNAVVWLSGAR